MRSLTLILIPLLFLLSCTIDWKDEKDEKITELENQIVQIRDENSKLTYSMSATLSAIDDEKRLKADIQYELEAITSDIYTELQDRMGKDNSLVLFPDSGTYTYKNEVFEGKNTGFCLIAKNNDRSGFDEKEQVLRKCKSGNIILEENTNNNKNCILSPDGTQYVYPTQYTDTNWKKIGEYYKTTNAYVLFFNKRQGEYCDELIQTDPTKFRIAN